MATFEVTYTDGKTEKIEADHVTEAEDDYKFLSARHTLLTLIPRSQVRKIQRLKD